jgi:hypothetical protein
MSKQPCPRRFFKVLGLLALGLGLQAGEARMLIQHGEHSAFSSIKVTMGGPVGGIALESSRNNQIFGSVGATGIDLKPKESIYLKMSWTDGQETSRQVVIVTTGGDGARHEVPLMVFPYSDSAMALKVRGAGADDRDFLRAHATLAQGVLTVQ